MSDTRKKGVLYLAGPMASPKATKEQLKQFREAAAEYEKEGWTVINPTTCLPEWMERQEAIQACIALINSAEAVLVLPGWKKSEGSRIEYAYAKYIGMRILATRGTDTTEPEFSDARKQAAEIIAAIFSKINFNDSDDYNMGYRAAMGQAARIAEKISGVQIQDAMEIAIKPNPENPEKK